MQFEFGINREVVDSHVEEFCQASVDRLELEEPTHKQHLLKGNDAMSTYYETSPGIPYKTLKENLPAGLSSYRGDNLGTLEAFAVTDGEAYLWVYPSRGMSSSVFVRYGNNKVNGIIKRLSDAFSVEFASEYDIWPCKEGVTNGSV
jgi:hypothetical protein